MTINFEILWTHLLTATHPQILFCPNFQWKEPSSYQLSSYSTSLHGLCGYSFLFIFDHNIQVEFHGAHIAHLHPAPQPGKNQPLQSIDHCFESAKHHALQAEAEKSFEEVVNCSQDPVQGTDSERFVVFRAVISSTVDPEEGDHEIADGRQAYPGELSHEVMDQSRPTESPKSSHPQYQKTPMIPMECGNSMKFPTLHHGFVVWGEGEMYERWMGLITNWIWRWIHWGMHWIIPAAQRSERCSVDEIHQTHHSLEREKAPWESQELVHIKFPEWPSWCLEKTKTSKL